jgi:hypothetical protein
MIIGQTGGCPSHANNSGVVIKDKVIRKQLKMVPVILFVYKRLDVLEKTLGCLRENHIPKLIIYSDGAKSEQDSPAIQSIRDFLSKIDWCEVERHDRPQNYGLGKNILTGVTEVLESYESVLVWEDDLICVPGTYAYLCAALEHYSNEPRVMSVTGWTNRHVTPSNVEGNPYFDGRAESLVWGTWRRAWLGMTEETALEKMAKIQMQGGNIAKYGGDLSAMAKRELASNIWAVRFLYHHILNQGLCLRPPWSMVEHIGFDARSTNANSKNVWFVNGELSTCPSIPEKWPEPVENSECAKLHSKMCPRPLSDRYPRLVGVVRRLQRLFIDFKK